MFKLLKVAGSSLMPVYQDGDFVVIFKNPFTRRQYRTGDVIVFDHPQYGTMIKQIQEIYPDGCQLTVLGTHPLSIDSRLFGPVNSKETLGKVIWHIKKKVNK